MATRIELPKSPLQFGDADAAPASGGLFGGGGFGDDQFAQLLMGLALLDSGRPRVNPPSAMETIAPLAAMLSQQSNQKNALNFFNSVNKNAPSAAGLLAGGTDASPDVSAYTGMPGSVAPGSMASGGGNAAPSGGGSPGSPGSPVEKFLDLTGQHESGWRNIMQQAVGPNGGYNPSTGGVTGPSSAQGYYQITNSTWRDFAPKAGVDLGQFPTAMSAPADVQRQVARTIATTSGVQHWTDYNPRLRAAALSVGLPASGPLADNAGASSDTVVGGASSAPRTMRLASATPQTMTDAAPEEAPSSNSQGPVPSGSTASILAQYTPQELAAYRARGMIGPSGIPTIPPGSSKINSRGEPYSPDLETMPSQAKANVAASMATYRGEPNAAPTPTPVVSPRAAVTQAYTAGALPDISPQQLRQAQAAMPNTIAPRSPETVTGPRTQAAYAARMFDHWGRAAVGAGMLGTGGAGLVEYAKAQMQLATEFMKPSEAQKNIQMLPPELRPRAAYVLNMKGSPELEIQTEAGKARIQTQEAWNRPDASPGLAGAKAAATEGAQIAAKVRAMGLDENSPAGQAAAARMQTDNRPEAVKLADAARLQDAPRNAALAGAITGNAPTGPLKEAAALENMTPEQRANYEKVKLLEKQQNIINNVQNPIAAGIGDTFKDQHKAASAAVDTITAIHSARAELDKGIISGPGAAPRQYLERVGELFGIPPEQAANTAGFKSAIGTVTLSLAKQLGSGNGITNADRDFAERMSGGQEELGADSIRHVLDIREKSERYKINRFSTQAQRLLDSSHTPDSLKELAPLLIIDQPPEYKPPERQQSGPASTQPGSQVYDPRSGTYKPVPSAAAALNSDPHGEGTIATNPATGQSLIKRNGVWEKLP